MPLTYLIDENLRGDCIHALRAAAVAKGFLVDAREVGDSDVPPCGTSDPHLLIWCQSHGRILISRDYTTMASHLAAHLAAGTSSPGIFLIRANQSWPDVLDDLVYLAEGSLPDEWRDQILYIPI